jgi:hypothetical protein
MTQELRLLPERSGVIQQAAAIGKQLLAFTRQDETAPDPIKELEAELLLQVADLAREGGLRDVQVQCGPRHSAELCDGHEGPHVPQVHDLLYTISA